MYVITGATGNTGSAVVSSLLDRGQKVRAIGRNAERLQPLAARGAEPFVGDLANAEAMSKAFAGAQAVYVMIPPALSSPDFRAYQAGITQAVATALERAGIKHAVVLSSVGADKIQGTGPVVGLHELEQRLNRIAGLNVLALRAGYFMENTLAQIGAIETMGKTAASLRPDLKLPMIATRDIAAAAAEALLRLDFRGQQSRELLGQRDLSYAEATAIIGRAIRKPELAYVQVPDEQFRTALTRAGLSLDLANLILEMTAALNSGHMKALETRSARNTTPTTFESFVAEEFVSGYQDKAQAA